MLRFLASDAGPREYGVVQHGVTDAVHVALYGSALELNCSRAAHYLHAPTAQNERRAHYGGESTQRRHGCRILWAPHYAAQGAVRHRLRLAQP